MSMNQEETCGSGRTGVPVKERNGAAREERTGVAVKERNDVLKQSL